MPGQPAAYGVDEQPAGIRSAQRAGAGNRSHGASKALGRRAALALDRAVGVADPQRRLVSVAVRAQPSRQPAERFAYVPLIGEAAHQRVVRAAVHGEDSVALRGDAPALDEGGGGVGQGLVLQRPGFVVAGEFYGAYVVDRSYAGDGQLRRARGTPVDRVAEAPQLIGTGSRDRLKARAQASHLSVNVAENGHPHARL
jgi:hypothetical protein